MLEIVSKDGKNGHISVEFISEMERVGWYSGPWFRSGEGSTRIF